MSEASHQPGSCHTCGAPLSGEIPCPPCTLKALAEEVSPLHRTPSLKIPGLTLHEEIGEGGFGIVYRASQNNLVKREVALKILKRGVDTRAVLRRFSIERRALARLEHSHIARFYEAGETEDGRPWFTMELVEGAPITVALAGKKWNEIVSAFLKVCQAVTYAHEQNILHRDLKPTNILLSDEGEPKVIDFGMAKALLGEGGLTAYTADEVKVGTPAYQAPESIDQFDARSDVYSLGRTFAELIAGGAPAEVSRSLKVIVAQATHAEKEKRYQAVTDFSADLRKVQDGGRVVLIPLHLRLVLASLVFVALIGLVPLLTNRVMPTVPETNSPPKIEAVIHQASGHPAALHLRSDGKRALAIMRQNGPAILFDPRSGQVIATIKNTHQSLGSGAFSEDGNRFALGLSEARCRWYSAEDGREVSVSVDCQPKKPSWVNHLTHLTIAGELQPSLLTTVTDGYLRAFDSKRQMRWEVELVLPPYRLAVNSQRTHALTGTKDGHVQIIDLRSGKREIVQAHRAHIFGLTYAPNGLTFATGSYDHEVGMWKADGKLLWKNYTEGKVQRVVYSPNGQLLAAASWDGTASIWEVKTGQLLHQFSHKADCLCVTFSPDGKLLASGGRDKMIRLWDLSNGHPEGCYRCSGGVGELQISQHEEGLNFLALTWNATLEIIPHALFEK